MSLTRKEKYNLIKSATGDSQLARRARDWSISRINRELNITAPVVDSRPSRPSPKEDRPTETQIRKVKAREQYHEARKLGYTPQEATKMRYWSRERFRNTVQAGEVVDEASRDFRWASMARRNDYDDYLEAEAKRINKELGLDPDAKPGWASVYYWYIFGGNLDRWQDYMEGALDPFIPEVYRQPGLTG